FVTQAITHYRNVVTGGSEVHDTGGWWSPSGNWVVYSPGGYNDASPDEGLSGVDTEESSTTDLADWSRAFILEGPSQRPTDVVATRTADGIVVTWNDPHASQSDEGTAFDGYVVEARRLRDASWTSVGTVTGATTLPVVGLDASAHYVFRVTKTNIGMTTMLSAPSLPSRPVTTGSAVGITAETTATGGARISWDAVAAGSGEQIVEYRRLAAADWVRVGEFPAAAGVATIDGLPGGRHYTFRILAAGGVYTPRTRAVTTPVDADYRLGAEASAAGTVLTWNDPQAATRTETVVEYRRLKDAGWAALGTVASSAGAISIDGLVPNANYVFRLRQRDASGFVSRTVATRAVTTAPDCVFPPACVDFPGPVPQGGSFLIVNPNSGSGFGTEIAGGGGTSTTGGAGSSTVSGTLIATGTIVPIDGITGTFVLGNAGGDDTAG
ncbi:MAG: fibronectin type III domain-containing protein, partial [Planctomycetota bacterium]